MNWGIVLSHHKSSFSQLIMKKMWIEIKRVGSVLVFLLLASCYHNEEKEKVEMTMNIQKDPHSYANPMETGKFE